MSNQSQVFQEAIKNFLGPILHLLEDESITEVMINGHEEIWVEVAGKIVATDAKFADEDSLRAAVNNIAQSVGRVINDEEPRLDARLPNGYRIAAVLPPCSRKGTTVSIRKFSKFQMSFKDFIRLGAMTSDAAQFLDLCMILGKNILVSGGTGAGKTTLLGVLCDRIPKGQRLIVIEDSTELHIEYEHVVFFETRMADEFGNYEVTIMDLLRSSLRLRPDRIIVGEVRGAEALELIQAMNTGHKGCLGTIHANSANDSLVRLEALAQGGDSKIGERALRYQIGSAIDIIVQVSRYPDGSRKVATIAEVLGFTESGNYDIVPIYNMSRLTKGKDGVLLGEIEPQGIIPSFIEEIEDNGIPFPKSKFKKIKKSA